MTLAATLVRRSIALAVAALGLTLGAGCAGGGVPSSSAVVPDAGVAPASGSATCIIPGMWYFRGPCVEHHVWRSGATYALPEATFGITTALRVPSNDARSDDTFVAGEGTGDKNITGTFGGKKFPPYGTIACIRSSTGQTEPCPGKGLVYVLFYHPQSDTVTFGSAGFRFDFAVPAGMNGKRCRLNGWASNAWYDYQVYGTVRAGRMTMLFAPAGTLKFGPRVFEIFGISCS